MKSKSLSNKIIFVGLSGGVDSSVSAYLLKKQGYDVVGVYLKTWQPEWLTCTWRDEKRDAMRVCAHLNIPFVFMDVSKEYEELVARKMIEDYRNGKTPNPDVLCNRDIKFGVFLRRALEAGADMIATGHYARNVQVQISNLKSQNYKLQKGVDESKDQSYFLWTLTQKELSKTIFPIGHLKKSKVRKIAEKAGLSVAEKKDSQGICFIGDINMKDFLSHYIKERNGDVLDASGKIIGTHSGAWFYTLGERHGFMLNKKSPNDKPYYVVAKDVDKNTLTVSQENIVTAYSSVRANNRIAIEECNWISEQPVEGKKYTAQIRYHGEFIPCVLSNIGTGKAELVFKKPILVASGQSLVIYDGNEIIGGGVVV